MVQWFLLYLSRSFGLRRVICGLEETVFKLLYCTKESLFVVLRTCVFESKSPRLINHFESESACTSILNVRCRVNDDLFSDFVIQWKETKS